MLRMLFLIVFTIVSAVVAARENGHGRALGEASCDSTYATKQDSAGCEPALQELEQRTVTGLRLNEKAATTTVLTVSDFLGKYSEVATVLEQVSGVTIRRSGGFGEYTTATVRGGAPHQVQVFLDGLCLNSASGSAVDLSKLPLSSIQKITVYKASAPLSLMENSAGGVIALTTMPTKDIASFHTEMGSYGYQKSGFFYRNKKDKAINRLSLDYTYSLNNYPYLNDNGTPYNDSDDAVVAKKNNDYGAFSAAYAFSYQATPRSLYSGRVNFSKDAKQIHHKFLANDVEHQKMSNSTSNSIAEARVETRISSSHHYDLSGAFALQGFRTNSTFNDPLGIFLMKTPLKILDQFNKLSTLLMSRLIVGSSFSLILQLGMTHQIYSTTNCVLKQPDISAQSERFTFSSGIESSVTLPIPVRFHVRYNSFFAMNHADFLPNKNFTLIKQDNRSQCYYPNANGEVSYSLFWFPSACMSADVRYDNYPISFSDLYGKSEKHIGNQLLLPEKRFEYGVGVQMKSPQSPFHGSVALYQGTIRDRIGLVMQSQGFIMSKNIGSTKQKGIECELGYNGAGFFQIDNSLHWLDSRIYAGPALYIGKTPPYTPRFSNHLRVTMHVATLDISHTLAYRSTFFYSQENEALAMVGSSFQPDIAISLRLFNRIKLIYRIDNYSNSQTLFYIESTPLLGRMHYFVTTVDL
ncbi:MAG: TonB-dependent receptor plug domain-containing protein [Chitinivibrionales bacterium]|nr:TonB-dependent receptor plug domain-containing protein [Chitinivibrionales bacterium]